MSEFGALCLHHMQHLLVVQFRDHGCHWFFWNESRILTRKTVGQTNRTVDVKVYRHAFVLEVVDKDTLVPDPMHADVWIHARPLERFVQDAMPLDAVVLLQRLATKTRRIEEAKYGARALVNLKDEGVDDAVIRYDVAQAVVHFRSVHLVGGHKRIALSVNGEADKVRLLWQDRGRLLHIESRMFKLVCLYCELVLHSGFVGVCVSKHVAQYADLDLLDMLHHSTCV